MVACPAATGITSPVLETVARLASLVLHVTVWPLSTEPRLPVTTVLSCAVAPVPACNVTVAGVTATLATVSGGSVTVTVAEPVLPSTVAVIEACPAATAVTSPVLETVARVASLVLHVTVRPVSVDPRLPVTVAVSCAVAVAPACNVTAAGATDTAAATSGSCVTVMVALPVRPPTVAVMVACPPATGITSPELETVARLASLVLHVTVWPLSTEPRLPVTTALSCAVAPVPACSVTVAGVTATLATVSGAVCCGAAGASPPPLQAEEISSIGRDNRVRILSRTGCMREDRRRMRRSEE